MKKIHATGLSEETYCGIYVTSSIVALNLDISGNINKVTCERCLNVVYKKY